jgi:hypothetical protein
VQSPARETGAKRQAKPAKRRHDPRKADTSKEARLSAIQSIPFEKLKPEARKKVSAVLAKTTIFRRLPVHVAPCDPDLYLFLVRHPDVLVGVWEELGVSDFRMAEVSPEVFHLADGSTATAKAELIYKNHDTHIVYCEGKYQGKLLPRPITGQSVMILRTGYLREADGRFYITSRLDVFTHVDNATADFLTRTLEPIVGKIADHNFLQVTSFVGSLSRTTQSNHRGIQRLSRELHRVKPKIREEFSNLAVKVAKNEVDRRKANRTPVGIPVASKPGKTVR